jgi:putative heme transporter
MTGFQVFRNTMIILFTLALAYLFVLTLNTWIILLIAIITASAVRSPILRLKSWGLPQGVAIFIVYGLIAVISITLIVAVIPPIANQFIGYLQNEDRLANRIIVAQSWVQRYIQQSTGSEVELGIASDEIRSSVREFVNSIRVSAPNMIDDVSDFISNFVLVIVIGIYWLTSRERAESFLLDLLPVGRQAQARAIFQEVETNLGAYVRGIVLVSLLVGTLSFIVMTLLGVPGAATLSFIYGLATAIPIIGGLIGVLGASGLVLLTSPNYAVTVLIITILLQQLENYYLSPRIMAQSADFDEILVIVFIAAGFTLNGLTGALIAIPVAATASILLKHLVFEPRKAQVSPINNKVEGGILLQKTPTDPAPLQEGELILPNSGKSNRD